MNSVVCLEFKHPDVEMMLLVIEQSIPKLIEKEVYLEHTLFSEPQNYQLQILVKNIDDENDSPTLF